MYLHKHTQSYFSHIWVNTVFSLLILMKGWVVNSTCYYSSGRLWGRRWCCYLCWGSRTSSTWRRLLWIGPCGHSPSGHTRHTSWPHSKDSSLLSCTASSTERWDRQWQWLTGRLGCLAGWLFDWLCHWLADWSLISWIISWLSVHRLASWITNCTEAAERTSWAVEMNYLWLIYASVTMYDRMNNELKREKYVA